MASKSVFKLSLIGLSLSSIVACSSDDWQTTTVPTSNEVRAILVDNNNDQQASTLNTLDYPDLIVPQNVRPCCAFGDLQKVNFGPIPVPFFHLHNVIEIDEIGPHKFASGVYSSTSKSLSPTGVGGVKTTVYCILAMVDLLIWPMLGILPMIRLGSFLKF
ncbi:DUF4056 domain-containing protein [Vibrio sp. SS-MA-C1-2]|uniref:DUF4056 domain-containing protein n=1 Tax=Vibrio sp. SS-MA-C1-2 TaxID=2908646 RepID=UPI0021A61ED9|nr:DUF4056 domain-containing protein [Vibrio sp. SS-MA-C1-2]